MGKQYKAFQKLANRTKQLPSGKKERALVLLKEESIDLAKFPELWREIVKDAKNALDSIERE
jgi:hypothetical protein